MVKNPPAMQRPELDPWVGKISWRRDRLPTPVFLGFPGGSVGKESTYNAGDPGFDPWVRKIPWRRHTLSTPVFLGFLGGSEGEESACNAEDLGSIPGWEDPLEESMATHSRILA